MVTYKRDRYVVFRIISELEELEEIDVKNSIWQTYQTLFGLYGSAGSGLYFEDYSKIEKTGIFRCSHTSLPQLLTVLAFISKIKKNTLLFQVLNVSGTINKAKKILNTK